MGSVFGSEEPLANAASPNAQEASKSCDNTASAAIPEAGAATPNAEEVVHACDDTTAAAIPERAADSGAAQLRGRALIRSHTTPMLGADSQKVPTSAIPAKPQLLRAKSAVIGTTGGVGRRLVPTRSTSADRGQANSSVALVAEEFSSIGEVATERGSSLPPKARTEQEDIPKVDISPPCVSLELNRNLSCDVRQQIRNSIQPSEKVLGRDVRRQLRIIVGGLMGSGKSTLCRMLADLLDGTWVNQDEFAHKGRGAKTAFHNEIKSLAKDRKVPVLVADKINTQKVHRNGIRDAMDGGVSGDVVFVQVAHPLDEPGKLDHQMTLCLDRIHKRGSGHRTLMGDDPKLQSILKMTVANVEPMDDRELQRYNGNFLVDMTLPPKSAVLQLLADLDAVGFLGRFRVEELVTEDRLEQALSSTKNAEAQLGGGTQEEKPAADATGGKQKKKSNKPQKLAPVMFYELQLDVDVCAKVRELWGGHAQQAPQLNPSPGFHVTLLYIGGRSDEQICKDYPHIKDKQEVQHLRENLAGLEGTSVDFHILSVAWDSRIAAAEIAALPSDKCANRIPHITLALKPSVPPSMSNELLARRAANLDLDANLAHWLSALRLSSYCEAMRQWCKTNGVASADEVVAHAEDLAAALEANDLDQRARLKQTLLQTAAAGAVCEDRLKTPLQLRGQVHARRKGE